MTRSVQRPQSKLLAAQAMYEDAPALVKPCLWLDAQREQIDLVDETSCLMASWNCDDGSGTTLTDQTGGYNGTAATGTWVTDGGVTAASGDHAFDSSADDYVTITHDAAFSRGRGSVSMWIKMTGTLATWDSPLAKGTSGWASGFGFYYNTELRFWVGYYLTYAGSGTVPDSSWHHHVGTWDGSFISHYVDGVLTDSKESNNTSTDSNSFQIGRGSLAPYYWPGYLDRVAFWTEPLSPDEVAHLYAAGSPSTNPPSLLTGGVDAWRDRSVYRNTGADDGTSYARLTTGNSSGRPIKFDTDQGPTSVGQYIDCALAEVSGASGWTVFAAVRWVRAVSVNPEPMYLLQTTDTYNSIGIWALNPTPTLTFGCYGTSAHAYREGTTVLAAETDYLITARYDGTQGVAADRLAQLRVGKVDETLGSVTGTPAATCDTVTTVRLPYGTVVGTKGSDIRLYEMIVVPRSCSAAEIDLVEDYLSTKWGI